MIIHGGDAVNQSGNYFQSMYNSTDLLVEIRVFICGGLRLELDYTRLYVHSSFKNLDLLSSITDLLERQSLYPALTC